MMGVHSAPKDSEELAPSPWLTTLVPRRNRFNGLKNDARSPLVFPLRLLCDRNRGIVVVTVADEMARLLPDEEKLDFGTAIMVVIGGDDEEVVAEDVIFNPSEVGDQGLMTLMHDREFKSHIRRVPSSDPLANKAVLPAGEEDVKSAGSNNAKEVTAFA
mmetsp:Transcript_20938/g.44189  ORF Transcript_20938/g.44189 Transcript_20938/m.44189 type:complete len:159 (-) Transcript_20938:678-1154(-)